MCAECDKLIALLVDLVVCNGIDDDTLFAAMDRRGLAEEVPAPGVTAAR